MVRDNLKPKPGLPALSRHPEVSEMMNFITASFRSGDNQVHGVTYDTLKSTMAQAATHRPEVACLLRASYSLAYYALLRPTEYMLTPLHNTFDSTTGRGTHVPATSPSIGMADTYPNPQAWPQTASTST